PVAVCVRALMIDRTIWTGSASELLRLCAEHARVDISNGSAWAKNPRALAGRLRRGQTVLPTLGLEIHVSREGPARTRMTRGSTCTCAENTVSTVSIVGPSHSNGSRAIKPFQLG